MVNLSFGSRLYGRDEVQAQLQQAYHRLHCRQRPCEFVLISGEAGSGKTVLARTLSESVHRDGGYFCSGKFDPSSITESSSSIRIAASATTLLPLTNALSEWMYQIHRNNDSEQGSISNNNNQSHIHAIRNAVLQQLGEESQAYLRRIIPGFELIMVLPSNSSNPKQTNNNDATYIHLTINNNLPTTNDISQEVIKVILSKFILAVTGAAKDVSFVLALDDLQWADDLTLDILHSVLTSVNMEESCCSDDNSNNLLLLGTVRSEEPSTRLTNLLALLQDEADGVTVTSISIHNLTENDIQQLVRDVLNCSDATSQLVSSRIHQQTKGNALFVRQALQSFVDHSDLLVYHPEEEAWELKDDRTQQLPVLCASEDLLSATVNRMKQQDNVVQHHLKVAACLGNSFPADVWNAALTTVSMQDDLLNPLTLDSEAGSGLNLLVRIGYLVNHQDEADSPLLLLQWQHDVVWQAAYSLILDTERSRWHATIGLALWQTLSETRIDDLCFLVLRQLSFGITTMMLKEKQEHVRMANLCLRAGEKAALSSSFQTAASCLQLGIHWLGVDNDDDGWTHHYDLCLALRNAAAEACFCTADFDGMDQQFHAVLRNATNYKDTLRARTMQIYALSTRGNFQDAYEKGIEALQCLGIRFPHRSYPFYIFLDHLRTRRMLHGKTDRTLLSLPLMKDEDMMAAMSILFVFIVVSINYRPRLLPFITTCMVRMTLKYGLCPASSQAFLGYGVYMMHLGQRQEAYRFGQLALGVVQTLNAKEFLPRVYVGVYNYTNPFCRPLCESLEPLLYAHRAGLETGDLDMAAKSLFIIGRIMLWAGKPLAEVREALKKSLHFANMYKMNALTAVHKLLLQFLDNLMVRTNDPLVVTGAMISQDDAYETARHSDNQFMLVYLPMARLWLAFYLNDYELAWQMADKCRRAIKESKIAYFVVCVHRFLEGMTAAALFRHSQKRQYLQVARRNLKELQQFARDAPDNCQNKVALLEAELLTCRRDGNNNNMDMALAKFVRSANLAAGQGFIHEQALAYEREGIALRRVSDFTGSIRQLQKAQDLYQEWGAVTKVCQMNELYGLQQQEPAREDSTAG